MGNSLSPAATYFLYNGIGEGTRKGYDAAQRSFLAWARESGVSHPFPASATSISNWIAALAIGGLRPGSIRGYMSGLRSLHTDLNFSHSAFDNPQVDRVFRGIRRAAGEVSRRRRLPITLPILVLILDALPSLPVSDADRTTLAAAFALAYVGGMRCGELTYDVFDPEFHISISDVCDLGSYATVRLPASKTDPFRRGVLIVVPSAPSGAPVDPLALLRAHMRAIPPGQTPLFSRTNFRAAIRTQSSACSFPRAFFVDSLRRCLIRAGLNASEYAGHSFRRDMATWAKLSAKMDDGDIKLLGRWSSDAVKLYQETPTYQVALLAQRTLSTSRFSPSGIVPPARCWWGDE